MTLKEQYKKETNLDIWTEAELDNQYYDNEYVEWLEAKINYTRCCDFLPNIDSNIFKTWYETHGYTTTLNNKLLEKDGSEYDLDNVFKHYCNLLEFGN
jgi:hypothetical protein